MQPKVRFIFLLATAPAAGQPCSVDGVNPPCDAAGAPLRPARPAAQDDVLLIP